MGLSREKIENIIFGIRDEGDTGAWIPRRFTQDSPVLPDVWFAYNAAIQSNPPGGAVDLLLTSNRASQPRELHEWMLRRLQIERKTPEWKLRYGGAATAPTRLLYNESACAVNLRFDELVRVALPLTRWWSTHAWNEKTGCKFEHLQNSACLDGLVRRLESARSDEAWSDLLWLIQIIGTLQCEYEQRAQGITQVPDPTIRQTVEAFVGLTKGMALDKASLPSCPVLWSVNRNRPLALAVWRSVLATKADAATRLFNLSCRGLTWAIVDTGIDATHPAFRQRGVGDDKEKLKPKPFNGSGNGANQTRVRKTYDFTRLRQLLGVEVDSDGNIANPPWLPLPEASAPLTKPKQRGRKKTGSSKNAAIPNPEANTPASSVTTAALPQAGASDASGRPLASLSVKQLDAVQEMRVALQSGRTIDWHSLEPLLNICHEEGNDEAGEPRYAPPLNEHGTHVAGILAGDWRISDKPRVSEDHDLRGVCPDLTLFDLRVLDAQGNGDEFAVLAALQFIRWLNANKDAPVVHGVNISMSMLHDVANFACGRTPVCDECERLVGSGVVVVAAAGNEGYSQFNTPRGTKDGYRSISITDPGNAQGVLTVGATHRFKPHTYGVSYFSSRGPTGDGRSKPDLVAPGEKIKSVVPKSRDGNWSAKTLDGTSMAAPHVSGAAALLMARHSELIGQPERIKEILCKSATDLGREKSFQGAGMVDVLRALQSV